MDSLWVAKVSSCGKLRLITGLDSDYRPLVKSAYQDSDYRPLVKSVYQDSDYRPLVKSAYQD